MSSTQEETVTRESIGGGENDLSWTTITSKPLNHGHSSASNASPAEETVPSRRTVERTRTAQDDARHDPALRAVTTASATGPVYSIFTTNQKRFIIFMASWAGFFSPVSANIYFPALNALATDLKVSNTLINLTLTSYMIFQGLAPAFIGSLADSAGRRPAYIVCFVVYIAANVGLALQNNYAALFVLRCLQSTGSSATIAMASGVVSDVSTPAERGAYMGFTFAGSLLGPAVGPVIGGLLAQFLGWRAIFWFLVIFAASFLVIFAIFFPETARTAVGNGSIPPKGWNMSIMNFLAVRKVRRQAESNGIEEKLELEEQQATKPKHKFRFPNPLASLTIIWDRENALLLFYNAFLFSAFYDTTAVIPSQFAEIYSFNDLQIGLCYIPIGLGAMCAALTNGQLLDRNFARWCRKLGVRIKKGRNQDLRNFPIEKARLQVAIPAAYLACCMVLIFGWVLEFNGPLPAIIVLLFVGSFCMSIAFNVTSTLLVDFYPKSSATATAANNLVRCLLGAGATGVVIPMIDAMGRGWTFTFLSLVLIATSPMLWLVWFKGMGWREERRVRDERKQLAREKKNMEKTSEEGEQHITDTSPVGGGMSEMAAVVEEEHEANNQTSEANRIVGPVRKGRSSVT